jgi:SAM-dependent methyltransferase
MAADPGRNANTGTNRGLNQYALSGTAAEMYERNMVPAIFEPFARDLLEVANLKAGEKVLDVACGTGIVARLAWPKISPTGSVVGSDLNSDMLDVARERSRQQAADIAWTQCNVSAMSFSPGEFDVVLCQHGLQYFPDRPAALNEMHRVSSAGGRLIASVWRPISFNPAHSVFADVLERLVSPEAAATRRAPYKLSDRTEIRALVSGSGFHDVVVSLTTRAARFVSAEAMVHIMMAGTPLGAAMADTDPGVVQRVIDEVTGGLTQYEDDRGLAIPMQAWVITARA